MIGEKGLLSVEDYKTPVINFVDGNKNDILGCYIIRNPALYFIEVVGKISIQPCVCMSGHGIHCWQVWLFTSLLDEV